VIPGYRPRETPPASFDIREEGTRPCLILEVVSPSDPELWRNDHEKKVEIYRQAGIPEYVLLDPPRPVTQNRLLLTGYRLGREGRYRRIEPDGEGRLYSETTQLLFGVDPDGKTLVIVDAATGQRLQTSEDLREALQVEGQIRRAAEELAAREADARRAAEELAACEADARRAAEDEIARMRAELGQLGDKARRNI
jgi:hypothetical protein